MDKPQGGLCCKFYHTIYHAFRTYANIVWAKAALMAESGQVSSTRTTTKSNPQTTAPVDADNIAPKEPFNLRVITLKLTGLAQSYVDLEWDKVTDPDLGGYLIYYGSKSKEYYYIIDNGTANTIRVNNLISGQSYFFAARAYDKSGNLSNFSNEVEASLLERIGQNYWWAFVIAAGPLLLAIIGLIIYNKKLNQNQSYV